MVNRQTPHSDRWYARISWQLLGDFSRQVAQGHAGRGQGVIANHFAGSIARDKTCRHAPFDVLRNLRLKTPIEWLDLPDKRALPVDRFQNVRPELYRRSHYFAATGVAISIIKTNNAGSGDTCAPFKK